MADGERDQAQLDRQFAELTRRIAELEGRIAEIEGRPAAAAQPPRQEVVPPQQQYPWQGSWQSQGSWGQPGRPPQPQWGPPPVPPQPQWGPPPAPPQPAPPQPAPFQPAPPQAQARRPEETARPLAPNASNPQLRRPGFPDQPPQPVNRPEPQRPAGQDPRVPDAGSTVTPGPAPVATPRPMPQTQSLSEELGISLASLRDLESRLTGRLLAWVGAAAVVLGTVFFLSLAFSRGWIGPEGRVAMGLLGGGAFFAAGMWLFGRRQESLGHVMVGVGLGVVSLSLFAGTRFYSLYTPETALAGSFVAAVITAMTAVRVKSEALAIFGLLAIAAAPPIMGAGANAVTIAFLAVTVAGTTGIALAKSWRWLPPTAFVITAPQLAFWLVSRPDATTAVVAIGAYWLLHAVAASADELRTPREGRTEEEAARSASLFFVNSSLAVMGGLYVLAGNNAAWEGSFVAAAALAHFAFGGYFVWRRGEADPFGLFINAVGAVLVALAIERQFDGAAVVVGWAIEAAVLAAVFGSRRNPYVGSGSALLGVMATAHLMFYEYSWLNWSLSGRQGAGPLPFADSAGIALCGVLIAGFASGWLSKRDEVRLALLIAAAAIFAYSLPFELSGSALVIAWALVGAALSGAWFIRKNGYLGLTAVLIGGLAVAHLGAYEYPLLKWTLHGTTGPGAFPFIDSSGLALAGLLGAALAAGLLSRSREVRIGLAVAGALVTIYSLPFELSGASLVIAWALVGTALAGAWRIRRNDYVAGAAALAGILAVMHLGLYEYPCLDWTLLGTTGPGAFPFANASGVALAGLLGAALLAGLLSGNRQVRIGLAVAGSLLVTYSLPFELSGPALVGGWCVVGVALTAVCGVRRDVYIASAAFMTGLLAVAHLVAYDYALPLWSLRGAAGPGSIAFADSAGLSLAILLVAAATAGLLSRNHSVRCAMATSGLLLVIYALPFELSGVALVAGWSFLLPVSIAAEGLLDRLPGAPPERATLRSTPVLMMNDADWPDALLLPAAVAAVAALSHWLAFDIPVASAASVVVPVTPFADLASVSAAAGIAAFLLAAAITARPDVRIGTILIATAMAAYTTYNELALPFAVVTWCALAITLGAWSFRREYGRLLYVGAAGMLVGIALVAILGAIVPLERLGVHAGVTPTGTWFAIHAILAIGATSLAVAVGARFLPIARAARSAFYLASGIGLVYLASVLVVDFFERQVGGSMALEELQKQAQVGVSILWGLIGMTVFLTGIIGWRQGVREAGLGLLALATGKVFIFDLSYLDVAYRVLSLVGLGLLLLVGAFAYQSLRPRRPTSEETPDAQARTP